MKKQYLKYMGLLTCVATLLIAGQALAADLAAASGVLADVAVISTQASADLAVATGRGVDAITEAQKRAAGVDAAMGDAQDAYTAMERAVAGGDEDAATAAKEDLDAAHQAAQDALGGAAPDAVPQSKHDQWKESQTNTGGGPAKAYDPPNIYDIPSQTQGLRQFYQSLFGHFWSSSSFGSGNEYHEHDDGDATDT
jgi:hypothetical protein